MVDQGSLGGFEPIRPDRETSFDAGFTHTVEEMRHRLGRVRNAFLDPRNRDFGLHIPKPCNRGAGFFRSSSLRQTCTMNAMSRRKAGTFSYRITRPFDGLVISTGKVVGNAGAGVEKCNERIMRAHANRLLEIA